MKVAYYKRTWKNLKTMLKYLYSFFNALNTMFSVEIRTADLYYIFLYTFSLG